jgi:uncharacterized protein YdbL (DUF1318 family)
MTQAQAARMAKAVNANSKESYDQIAKKTCSQLGQELVALVKRNHIDTTKDNWYIIDNTGWYLNININSCSRYYYGSFRSILGMGCNKC